MVSNVRFGSVFQLQSASNDHFRKLNDCMSLDHVEDGWFEQGSIDVKQRLETLDPDYKADPKSKVVFHPNGGSGGFYLATGKDAQAIESVWDARHQKADSFTKYVEAVKQLVEKAQAADKLPKLLVTTEITNPNQLAPVKVIGLDLKALECVSPNSLFMLRLGAWISFSVMTLKTLPTYFCGFR
jgi:hypothetical protein